MLVPDFFAALYAAVTVVESGQAAEAHVEMNESDGDRSVTLSVTVRRYVEEPAATD